MYNMVISPFVEIWYFLCYNHRRMGVIIVKFFADIKQIIIVDDLNEVNNYLKNGAVFIDTLVTRDGDEVGFFDTAHYIVGLPNAQ